jgi:aconitate hydratase
VIAESYERIHRSNLVGMGILPLQFKPGENAESLGLTGTETYSVPGSDKIDRVNPEMTVRVRRDDGSEFSFQTIARIDTAIEVDYYRNGGILHTVLYNLLKNDA